MLHTTSSQNQEGGSYLFKCWTFLRFTIGRRSESRKSVSSGQNYKLEPADTDLWRTCELASHAGFGHAIPRKIFSGVPRCSTGRNNLTNKVSASMQLFVAAVFYLSPGPTFLRVSRTRLSLVALVTSRITACVPGGKRGEGESFETYPSLRLY